MLGRFCPRCVRGGALGTVVLAVVAPGTTSSYRGGAASMRNVI